MQTMAHGGVVAWGALQLQAWPGHYNLHVRVVDAGLGSDQVAPLTVPISVPPCMLGSTPRMGGYTCQKCDPRLYSLWVDPRAANISADVGNSTSGVEGGVFCSACPDNAQCPGGPIIVPQSGYW